MPRVVANERVVVFETNLPCPLWRRIQRRSVAPRRLERAPLRTIDPLSSRHLRGPFDQLRIYDFPPMDLGFRKEFEDPQALFVCPIGGNGFVPFAKGALLGAKREHCAFCGWQLWVARFQSFCIPVRSSFAQRAIKSTHGTIVILFSQDWGCYFRERNASRSLSGQK